MSAVKVVIPARYGSTRLPRKALLEINNKPIFWHVYQRVLEADFSTNEIYIATDHIEIFELAKSLGLNVVMTSVNHESGTDRINEVCQKLKWQEETIVINVQGDEPLIPPKLIKRLRKFAIDNPKYDMTTAVTPIKILNDFDNPNIVKVAVAEEGRAIYFSRARIPYNRDDSARLENCHRHIGIYSYNVEALREICEQPVSELERLEKLEQLRALSLGYTIGAIKFDEAVPHGIDVEEDFEKVKSIMEGKREYS